MFAPVALVGMAVFAFIGGNIVRLLWNWLVPSLFGLPAVTFWQALGVLALCRILFGGHGGMRRRSKEERLRFRQAFNARFGLDDGSKIADS
jgi:hypothetical protein